MREPRYLNVHVKPTKPSATGKFLSRLVGCKFFARVLSVLGCVLRRHQRSWSCYYAFQELKRVNGEATACFSIGNTVVQKGSGLVHFLAPSLRKTIDMAQDQSPQALIFLVAHYAALHCWKTNDYGLKLVMMPEEVLKWGKTVVRGQWSVP